MFITRGRFGGLGLRRWLVFRWGWQDEVELVQDELELGFRFWYRVRRTFPWPSVVGMCMSII